MHDPVAYHLIPADLWAAAAPAEPLRVASLGAEGFVHLTHRMADLVEVANTFYRHDRRPHVVLTVRLASLTSPWRYDGDERYPHVYGPLDRTAITEVRPIPRGPGGRFLPIERPDSRRRPVMPALLAALVDGAVAFVVVGSGGAALLGADLVPGDLDVCVATDVANLERLGAVLVSVGARPRVSVPGWVTDDEAAAWRPVPSPESLELLFETAHGDLDVLFASLAPDGRGEVQYPELAARRPKDLRAREALERLVAEARR